MVFLCVISVVSLQTDNSAENTITQVWEKNQSLPFVFFDSLGIVLSLGESIQVLVYSECLKILLNENDFFQTLATTTKIYYLPDSIKVFLSKDQN